MIKFFKEIFYDNLIKGSNIQRFNVIAGICSIIGLITIFSISSILYKENLFLTLEFIDGFIEHIIYGIIILVFVVLGIKIFVLFNFLKKFKVFSVIYSKVAEKILIIMYIVIIMYIFINWFLRFEQIYIVAIRGY
ncbi:MAG: hypothetical protein JW924_06095 [Fusobacteriaceae bacterium]|nr:hypothetical protein [Fusobacteriaceae bacterium]